MSTSSIFLILKYELFPFQVSLVYAFMASFKLYSNKKKQIFENFPILSQHKMLSHTCSNT